MTTLSSEFADSLPELARDVRAATAPDPRVLALNTDLAGLLGLDDAFARTPDGLRLLTGERLPAGARPVAQVYAGHQWGRFTPILGDGRALLAGEFDTPTGRLDLHFKGIGATPLSRIDGNAAVGPMLREYLFGEAMHALGVPTTRALAVTATGATFVRDGVLRPGAVLARTARSHLRIGTVEYAAAAEASGTHPGLLRRVADHAIARLHPEAALAAHPHDALYAQIVGAHARLTAQWMGLGFVHGVLSTDNVTLSAETIDYGPCAFLDAYRPGSWFSSIDEHGRYAYARQPDIMAWNLTRLGDALAPLFSDADEVIVGAIDHFWRRYAAERAEVFRAKLGLPTATPAAAAAALADDLLALLEDEGTDATVFFRALGDAADGDDDAAVTGHVLDTAGLRAWLDRWHEWHPSSAVIRRTNPAYIPRNHLVDAALADAERGDLTAWRALLDVVRRPFSLRSDVPDEYRFGAPAGSAAYVTYCGT